MQTARLHLRGVREKARAARGQGSEQRPLLRAGALRLRGLSGALRTSGMFTGRWPLAAAAVCCSREEVHQGFFL